MSVDVHLKLGSFELKMVGKVPMVAILMVGSLASDYIEYLPFR